MALHPNNLAADQVIMLGASHGSFLVNNPYYILLVYRHSMGTSLYILFSISPIILSYVCQLDRIGFVDYLFIGQNNSYLIVASVLMRSHLSSHVPYHR